MLTHAFVEKLILTHTCLFFFYFYLFPSYFFCATSQVATWPELQEGNGNGKGNGERVLECLFFICGIFHLHFYLSVYHILNGK